MVDKASYVPAAADIVTADGKLWGAPTSFGNQLMLYWDKALVGDTAPADSDAWVAKAKELTTGDNYGIVFNQTESFWLVPVPGRLRRLRLRRGRRHADPRHATP